MGKFDWWEDYSTGNQQMDNQHKKLFGYIQDLHEAMQVGKGKDILEKTLDGLIDYTRTHFKDEEELLKKYNYPGLLAQQIEHERLTTTVIDLQEKFKKGQAALSVTTSNFLKDWLMDHILGTDKKYGPFLKKLGEK